MMRRSLAMMGCALGLAVGAGNVRADEPAEADAQAKAFAEADTLVGFWRVDMDAMRNDPRFASTLESDQGRAGVEYAQGALFEFTSDHHVRMHMGSVDDRAATISPAENGAIRIDPEGATAWVVKPESKDAFVQRFPDVDFEIRWRRSWDPFVGTWRVATDQLGREQWYSALNQEQRDALKDRIESLRVSVDENGAVQGTWDRNDHNATIKLESTVPPAAALIESSGGASTGHFVRRDDGASLYVGDRTWPLVREHPPSAVVVGTWQFDMDRALTMDWFKRVVPEGKTLEQFLKENVKTDVLIPVTPQLWNNQRYTVVDERGNQFAAIANNQVVFWVRVLDDDHISQFASGGREFPLKRVAPAPKPASPDQQYPTGRRDHA